MQYLSVIVFDEYLLGGNLGEADEKQMSGN
ncbi:hypothetical protein BH11CYA1_BH11CYA1_12910 [soil metagenome]